MYSDEEYWSDPDQLVHYSYIKGRYGYQAALDFKQKVDSVRSLRDLLHSSVQQFIDTEAEETVTTDSEEDAETNWIQEEISYETSEDDDVVAVRKKYKIQETSCEESEEEGSSTD